MGATISQVLLLGMDTTLPSRSRPSSCPEFSLRPEKDQLLWTLEAKADTNLADQKVKECQFHVSAFLQGRLLPIFRPPAYLYLHFSEHSKIPCGCITPIMLCLL